MTDDTKLRCALVYRLGDTPVVIAKYDHASQYETHGRTDQGTLYGGRDKSYADACGLIIASDPPGRIIEAGAIGGFKTVQSDAHQVVYGADRDGICCAVITGLGYPQRVSISMLTELHKEFLAKFGAEAASTAQENSLSRSARNLMSTVCKKYQDSSHVDKTQQLLGKVDGVKAQMQDNIADILENTDKAESLAEQSGQLQESAKIFQENSMELKNRMKWKNLKMTLILSGLCIGILVVIILFLVRPWDKRR